MRIGLVWLIAVLLQGVAAAESCGLRIGVVDSDGTPQPYRVESFRVEGGEEFAKAFRGLSVNSIPCGRYRYHLEHAEFPKLPVGRVGEVVLVSKSQWLTVATNPNLLITWDGRMVAMDSVSPRGDGIAVHVEGLAGSELTRWVRLSDPYQNRQAEVVLDSAGRFFLPYSFNRLSLVAILDSTGVVYQGSIDFRKGRPAGVVTLRAK